MKNTSKTGKSVDIKTTPSYLAGVKDAKALLSQYSLFMCNAIISMTGMCRKVKGLSYPKLYRYCEGLNDTLRRHAKKAGCYKGLVSQEDIGK